jgi:hypothetical protein
MREFKTIEDIIIFGKLVLEKDQLIKIEGEDGYNLSGDGYNFKLYLNDVENDNRFLEIKPKNDIDISISEISNDEDLEIKDYRIQLDIKTSRKKLNEINILFRKVLDDNL